LPSTDGQALPALRAAAFEHQAAVLGVHSNQKAMGAPSMTAIGLKGALHRGGLPAGSAADAEKMNPSEPTKRLSIIAVPAGRFFWGGGVGVSCQCSPDK